jgi:hypothetical protein
MNGRSRHGNLPSSGAENGRADGRTGRKGIDGLRAIGNSILIAHDAAISWQTWYMALPEPSSDRGRQLLQGIWNMSSGRRGGWPTLSTLRYSEAPRFGTGEVEALLARTPAGLINGIGPDGPGELADSQELSLTAAGVAACRDTELTLNLFLRFIRFAVSKESVLPSILSAYLSADIFGMDSYYRVSSTEFIRRESSLPMLPGRRGKLLRRLHLMLASEPAFWVNISYFSGDHWVAAFDRSIRYFKNIQTLDDYWAHRFKPWEAPGEIPYPVVAAGYAPDQASRPQLLCDHPDLLGDVLLGRVFDRGSGVASFVSCPRVDPDIDSGVTRQALRRLVAQGRIGLRDVGASRDLPDVMLTSDGVVHISSLRRDWADRKLRDGATRDALLAWLYDRRSKARGSSDIDDFFSDPRCAYSGRFFSLSDIEEAASYLREKNLIDIKRVSGKLSALRITASGIDCVEQGDGVAEYGKPAKTSVSYSFNAPVSGTNVAIGGKATQHATVSSLDTDSLRTLVQAIVEALPGLGFDAQFLTQTKDAANEVAAEIVQRQPDQPRLRVALGKVRDLLARAGNQALAAVLSAAIDYELGKLGIPPAS